MPNEKLTRLFQTLDKDDADSIAEFNRELIRQGLSSHGAPTLGYVIRHPVKERWWSGSAWERKPSFFEGELYAKTQAKKATPRGRVVTVHYMFGAEVIDTPANPELQELLNKLAALIAEFRDIPIARIASGEAHVLVRNAYDITHKIVAVLGPQAYPLPYLPTLGGEVDVNTYRALVSFQERAESLARGEG